MLSSIADQREIRDSANVGSFAASLIKKRSEIAPMLAVSQHHLISDHTEQRWRQCFQFASITWSYRTKMAPLLAVSQHHLIIQNKDGANVGSFAASPDHTEPKMAPILAVSQHHLFIQNKDGANVVSFAALLDFQPHLVIQFKDGVHVFLRDGTGCLSTKKLLNDTLLINMFKRRYSLKYIYIWRNF